MHVDHSLYVKISLYISCCFVFIQFLLRRRMYSCVHCRWMMILVVLVWMSVKTQTAESDIPGWVTECVFQGPITVNQVIFYQNHHQHGDGMVYPNSELVFNQLYKYMYNICSIYKQQNSKFQFLIALSDDLTYYLYVLSRDNFMFFVVFFLFPVLSGLKCHLTNQSAQVGITL